MHQPWKDDYWLVTCSRHGLQADQSRSFTVETEAREWQDRQSRQGWNVQLSHVGWRYVREDVRWLGASMRPEDGA